MIIKAGKLTLALTMIISGVIMLIKIIYPDMVPDDLWMYTPVVLIMLGLEIVGLNFFYAKRDDCIIETSLSSIFAIILIIVLFILFTSSIPVSSSFNEFN